jgi:plastocyanin
MAQTRGWHRSAAWAAGLIAATAVVAGCGGGSESASGGGSSSGSGSASSQAAPATNIKIVMKDNAFEPKDITVPVGKEITIEYDNQGAVMHNLVAESYSSPMVQAAEKGTMKVKFDKAGQVKFLCAFHQPGMDGTFTVK